MPYTSQTSNRIGGIFLSADGSQRVISDHLLLHAKLEDTTLLRLYYSSGTVEITGKRLDAIFNDVIIGKLGVVAIDAEDVSKSTAAPAISSIVYILESPLAASERGRANV
jgi:hypothetical protein